MMGKKVLILAATAALALAQARTAAAAALWAQAVDAVQPEFQACPAQTMSDLVFYLVIIVGIAAIVWLVLEFVSSLVFRKTISDTVHATLTSVATSINVNTQYLTDSLIKLAQLGHAERLEHLRMSQMLINEAFTTAKMAITLDQLKDMVKEIEEAGGGK
jgi:ABC-type multidrug transport system fused ATPase/permease subunit